MANRNNKEFQNMIKAMNHPIFKKVFMIISMKPEDYEKISEIQDQIDDIDNKIYQNLKSIISQGMLDKKTNNSINGLSNSLFALSNLLSNGFSLNTFSTLNSEVKQYMEERRLLEAQKENIFDNNNENYEKIMNSKEVRDMYVSLFGNGKKDGMDMIKLWMNIK